MIGDEPGILLIAWIAVAGHDDANDVLGSRRLAQPEDNGGIDAAAQADDEPACGRLREPAAEPLDSGVDVRAHSITRMNASTTSGSN